MSVRTSLDFSAISSPWSLSRPALEVFSWLHGWDCNVIHFVMRQRLSDSGDLTWPDRRELRRDESGPGPGRDKEVPAITWKELVSSPHLQRNCPTVTLSSLSGFNGFNKITALSLPLPVYKIHAFSLHLYFVCAEAEN